MPSITRHGFPQGGTRHKTPQKRDEAGNVIADERSKLYGHKWREARIIFLRRHPLCEHCKYEGIRTPATEVDHIIPHKGDLKSFWNKMNWMGLCKSHHSRKTAKENGGFGNQTK